MPIPHEIVDVRALTPIQRAILHHALLAPTSGAYHEQLVLCFEGELDPLRLKQAWEQVLARHDGLRGRFLSERVSSPVQAITRAESVQLVEHEVVDHAALPSELSAWLAQDLARPFDLAREHAMRFGLWRDGRGHDWLAWSFHHILLDGWSIGIVLDEVLALYDGASALPASAPYAPYLQWLAAQDTTAARDFWRTELAGYEGAALDGPGAGCARSEARAQLGASTAAALRAFAARQRVSLHHVMLAAWSLVLARQLDQDEVIVPTVVAGRPPEVAQAERLVGLLINTVPMRVRVGRAASFAALAEQVRERSLAAARYAYLPLAEISAALDHLLLVQGMPGQDLVGARCGAARVAAVHFFEQVPTALEVAVTPTPDAVVLCLRGEFDPAWLQRLADDLARVLEAVAQDAHGLLRELGRTSAQQRARVLAWGDGGPVPGTSHGTIVAAFDAQLARAPDAVAVVYAGRSVTLRELDGRANRLAQVLLAGAGEGSPTPIALVTERTVDMVAGLLAILRTGAAYVPVDPEFPPQRVRQMLEASACRQVLASRALIPALPLPTGVRVVDIDAVAHGAGAPVAARTPTPDDLAYVIFTSGSTGVPKAVMLRHRNVAAFFGGLPDAFGLRPGQRMLAVTTVSFDIAALELLGALCCGLGVVLASSAQARDPLLLADLIRAERVDVIQTTPTRLRLLLDAGASLDGVATLLVGGEALPAALAARLCALPHVRVQNVYGPTETTIWSAAWPLAPGPVRLGRALPGQRLLVLAAGQYLQPPGAVGEIAIAGAGVGAGYLNDPVQTAARFVTLAGIDGPVYLTGDLGRWDGEGQLEYLGRRDDQVKLNGMRIEIADVEQHLQRLPGVRDAAAAVRPNAAGAPELVAYLTGAPTRLAALRAALGAHLPQAMLPTQLVLLAALPQTPNGKTDRRALPAPPDHPAVPDDAPAGSEPRVTAALGVFAGLLGHALGPDDDFFLAGGHSLTAIQAVGRVNRALGSTYSLRDLYRARSAAALVRSAGSGSAPVTRVEDADDYPLSGAQQALWVLQQRLPAYAGYNVPGSYRVRGALDLTALAGALAALALRHEALRTVFRMTAAGPRQFVLAQLAPSLEVLEPVPAATLAATIGELTCRPFDLANGPLLRATLLPLDPDGATPNYVLLLVTHHIISDGWSDAILAADLAVAYRAALNGDDPTPALAPPPAIRYRDFCAWQARMLDTPAARAHLDYWRERLHELPQLELAADGRRARGLDRPGARIAFALDAAQAERWLALVPPDRRHATLAAAALCMLHLESGQRDLVLGMPLANRERPELQDQVGLHLNLLPLRQSLDPGDTLAQLCAQCAAAIDRALAHAEYPFARLVEDLGLAAAPGRHPVFDALLIVHQQPFPLPPLDGVEIAPYDSSSYVSRFDLDFEVWAVDGAVHGFLEYDAGLFSAARAGRIVECWLALLHACAEEPGASPAGLRARLAPQARMTAASLVLDQEF